MKFVPIPVHMLPVGQPLPVDLWNPEGVLLLRRGQLLETAADRERLRPHKPSATAYEAMAWQRAYERMVHDLLVEGVEATEVSRRSMPGTMPEVETVMRWGLRPTSVTRRRTAAMKLS